MRGTILGVHDGRGVLLGINDQRLEFPLSEWRSPGIPAAGQVVDYLEQNGEARAVFAAPASAASGGASYSNATVLGAIGVGCLVLGFIIPFLPTIAAFVLGVIGASQARRESNETALLLSRIAWIGALVLFVIGLLAVIAVVGFIGMFGLATAWHGLGPGDF